MHLRASTWRSGECRSPHRAKDLVDDRSQESDDRTTDEERGVFLAERIQDLVVAAAGEEGGSGVAVEEGTAERIGDL